MSGRQNRPTFLSQHSQTPRSPWSRASEATIAHDARVPVPGWLAKQFQATDHAIEIDGQSMRLFTRRTDSDTSLTLGSNADTTPGTANMYVVQVSGAR